MVAENAKPGDTSWRIPSGLAGPVISGYADTTQADAGGVVRLFVSTAAKDFTVSAYRMGYYGGADARLIWTSANVAGATQRRCGVVTQTWTVSCAWSASLTVSVTSGWPPGDYLLKLVADRGQQSYVPLTIADPTSRATYLVQNSVMTWQAWNNYGGYDLYGGAPAGKPASFAERARIVSFDRPYNYGAGAGDFLGNELPLVQFLEQRGLDVSYVSDIAVNADPSLLLNHRVFLSLGHDECWAMAQRNGIIQAIDHGVNAVFFGASPILRHVRMQPDALGPDRQMVDYRDPLADPIYSTNPPDATGNDWAQPPASSPANQITGETYGGYGINAALVISNAPAWPFDGTGLRNGSALPHVVRSDYDHYLPSRGGPRDIDVLASSPVTTPYGVPATANMTYYTNPTSQAGVIATGTNAWIASLAPCPTGTARCPAAALRTITENILAVFGAGPAGRTHPSTPTQ